MSALPTRIEREAGRALTPLQIFDITAAREKTLSRLLMLSRSASCAKLQNKLRFRRRSGSTNRST
jgi:hypothetical protein